MMTRWTTDAPPEPQQDPREIEALAAAEWAESVEELDRSASPECPDCALHPAACECFEQKQRRKVQERRKVA